MKPSERIEEIIKEKEAYAPSFLPIDSLKTTLAVAGILQYLDEQREKENYDHNMKVIAKIVDQSEKEEKCICNGKDLLCLHHEKNARAVGMVDKEKVWYPNPSEYLNSEKTDLISKQKVLQIIEEEVTKYHGDWRDSYKYTQFLTDITNKIKSL